jgi:hypothetical protein
VVITDALGKPQLREGFKPASRAIVQPGAPHLQLWSVSAYATFDPCRLTPDAGLDTATTGKCASLVFIAARSIKPPA